MESSVFNMDCLQGLKKYPDRHFDLAIVDPPYGIGEDWKKSKKSRFYKHSSTYKNSMPPGDEYFKELFRVSKNQIIWGANYYTEFLPARNSWIVWDKDKNLDNTNMSECELAWTSFNLPMRIIKKRWNGFLRCEKRYGKHPHEKPVSLYKWLLSKYAAKGQNILDTHLGSGSSRIAAHDMGLDFTAFEIDTNYFLNQERRFQEFIAQQKLIFKP